MYPGKSLSPSMVVQSWESSLGEPTEGTAGATGATCADVGTMVAKDRAIAIEIVIAVFISLS